MSWEKRLDALMTDPRPVTWTYAEVSHLLRRLGFALQPTGGGTSHRKWRLDRPGRPTVWIGLVERPGPLARGYIRDVQKKMRAAGLWPLPR